MALARNLQNNKRSIKKPKINKKILVYLVAGLAVILCVYGYVNIQRNIKGSKKKQEVKYDTGDKPPPQKVTIWVNADGGLWLRQNPDPKAKSLKLIPNGTSFEVLESQGDWYKVTYQNKTGWVKKGYVTTTSPVSNPTQGWLTYQNKNYSYAVRYPVDWRVQDYGENPATRSVSYVAFGPQLAASLDPANLPPVIIRVTNDSVEVASVSFKSASGLASEVVSVSGLSGTKYTYNDSSGTQRTAYVVSKGPKTFIIEESGGYADELTKIVSGLTLG